jgi:hypothetical protein
MRGEIWDSRVGDGKTCWKREMREGCDRKEEDREGEWFSKAKRGIERGVV